MKRLNSQELAHYLRDSPAVQQHFPHIGSTGMGLLPRAPMYGDARPSVEQLAQQLISEEEFAGLWLGIWLGTPRGTIIEQAVGMVIPPGYHNDYALLVGALKHAAQQQNKKMAGFAAAGLAILVLALLSRQ